VLRTRYEIDHYQSVYCVLSGYDDLPALRPEELDAHIASARRQPDIPPGQQITADRVIATGTV
jgi:phenylalanine-4-hydroxylase